MWRRRRRISALPRGVLGSSREKGERNKIKYRKRGMKWQRENGMEIISGGGRQSFYSLVAVVERKREGGWGIENKGGVKSRGLAGDDNTALEVLRQPKYIYMCNIRTEWNFSLLWWWNDDQLFYSTKANFIYTYVCINSLCIYTNTNIQYETIYYYQKCKLNLFLLSCLCVYTWNLYLYTEFSNRRHGVTNAELSC